VGHHPPCTRRDEGRTCCPSRRSSGSTPRPKRPCSFDELWDNLLAGGGSPTQCGWLKDRFGLSWQIIPAVLPRLLGDPDRGKAARAMQAMLTMVKIDGAALQRAFDGV
jgi:hypothetical protein